MPEILVNLILWAPFAVVFLICAVVFAIGGYRRGVLNALVSVGGTSVAAVLSVVLAKLVAPLFGPLVMKLLPFLSEDTLGILGTTLADLVQSAAAMVAAMLLFFLLLLIFLPVCKCLLKRYVRLPVGGKAMKWGGLAVRLLDAGLFAMLLLSPVYGTLYNYLPIANVVLQMQPEPNSTAQQVLDAAQTHPVVKLSGIGPVDWAYRSLSQLNTDAVSVNATELTDTVKDVSVLMAEIKADTDASSLDTTKKVLVYARDNLLEQEWTSQLIVNVGKDYLLQQVASIGGGDTMLAEVIADVQISPEQFQNDGKEILDVVIGVIELQTEGATIDGTVELTKKVGDLLTDNETVQQLRTQLYVKAAASVLNDDSEETAQKVAEHLESVELTPAQKMVEAQVFLQLLMGGDKESAIESLADIGIIDSGLLD